MSIDDAIANHSELIPEDVLESYAEFGDPAPAISTTFQLVEIEVTVPQAMPASLREQALSPVSRVAGIHAAPSGVQDGTGTG